MNDLLKNKLKSYSFWVSLASAVLLLVQTIGRPLGLVIDESTYMSIVNSVLGVFVVLGIISHPAQNLLKNSSQKTISESENVDFEKTESITQNEDIVANKCDIVAKNKEIVIDSKSDSDASKVDAYVDEDYNLTNNSRQKVEKAKQEFMNICN
mgnify:CR=1 FL=1